MLTYRPTTSSAGSALENSFECALNLNKMENAYKIQRLTSPFSKIVLNTLIFSSRFPSIFHRWKAHCPKLDTRPLHLGQSCGWQWFNKSVPRPEMFTHRWVISFFCFRNVPLGVVDQRFPWVVWCLPCLAVRGGFKYQGKIIKRNSHGVRLSPTLSPACFPHKSSLP